MFDAIDGVVAFFAKTNLIHHDSVTSGASLALNLTHEKIPHLCHRHPQC